MQNNVGLYKFQIQKTFTWEGVLENNINYIMKSHLTIWVVGLRWFFDKTYIIYFYCIDFFFYL